MEKILIDTDVVIDFLRGHNNRVKDIFQQIENKEIKAYISLISVIELYSGEDTQIKEKLEVLEQVLAFLKILELDLNVAKIAGSLKRRYKLGLADSIIAATSIAYQIKLLTFNTKHFGKIPGVFFYTLKIK